MKTFLLVTGLIIGLGIGTFVPRESEPEAITDLNATRLIVGVLKGPDNQYAIDFDVNGMT